MTDYTKMTGPELLNALKDDAGKWAEAFCQHARKNGIEIDEGWMISWFANAIETSHQHRSALMRPQ